MKRETKKKEENKNVKPDDGITERVVDINRQAPVGTTLTCPICDTTFVKANPEQVFCSPECRKKYERLEKGVRTEGKIEDELLDLWSNIKTRVKRVTDD